MHIVSLIWGILAILGMLVGFIPCLGALNWINIPFSVLGIIISAIAISVADENSKSTATAGIVLCSIAAILGFFRLVAGGGIL